MGCVNSVARISLCSAGLSCHFNETIIDLLILKAQLNSEASLTRLQCTYPQASGTHMAVPEKQAVKCCKCRSLDYTSINISVYEHIWIILNVSVYHILAFNFLSSFSQHDSPALHTLLHLIPPCTRHLLWNALSVVGAWREWFDTCSLQTSNRPQMIRLKSNIIQSVNTFQKVNCIHLCP